MGDQKTLAILLHRTLLANDDALLEFFTSEWGRVSIFAKKFAHSKKRAEIDFFRLIELQVFQGRNSKLLKSAVTTTLFPGFESSLQANQMGWGWIECLRKKIPEERPDNDIFTEVIEWFAGFDTRDGLWCDVAFRIRLLQHTGDCPRFDVVREDCWFDPSSKNFFLKEEGEFIFLPNNARQVCEFMRRNTPEMVHQKSEKLPQETLPIIQNVVSHLENFLL
jgi:recombinational DNA repair protein (RecF pathway)